MYTNVRISDSVVTNEAYAKRAVELGQTILSTCEHGWQGNYWECYKLAKQYGLKMLFASEAYWVKDRLEKDSTNCHIFLGAKNEHGRQCLNDILSEANLTGFYGRPRVDIPLLLSLPKDDVWVTSACLAGWWYEDAEDIWTTLFDHFGKNFFLEVQYHDTDKQREINERVLKLHNQIKAPLIMGCDSHFIFPQEDQNRIDFINSKGMHYADEDNWYMDMPDGNTAYERFAKQGVLTHTDIMDAINNTQVFCDVEEYDSPIFNSEIKMPTLYPDWTQEQRDEEYKRLVWSGWDAYKTDIPQEKWPHYEDEIKSEVQTVVDTHMADYFIDNYHIIRKGKENGGWLTKTGRGSAVSFITNKLLGFTEVDRIAASVKMYPERFMSATRILASGSLPDIDFNVADQEPFARAQQEVLGEDHAYPMVAYGTAKVSAAWKLYAKSQGVPFELANAVSDQIKRYEMAVKHQDEDDDTEINPFDYIDEQYREIFSKSKDYLGLITSWSVAPCSYLLYQGSIRREIGLVRVKDHLCCCMDGHWAEECHFLKNDLLTVQVVNLIYQAFHRIGKEPPNVNELLSWTSGDQTTWSMYDKGCTLCLNQVEREGTSARVRVYKPSNISELCAFVAAIRPGFKSMYKIFEARSPFAYGVKAFDDLIQTEEMPNSFILYQEQEMAALHYAGIPMSECYTAVKNIAKKRKEKVLAYEEKFKSGLVRTMIEDEHRSTEDAEVMAGQLWQIITDASSYSFNCISGDTRIQKVGGTNGRFQPTVEEMYMIWKYPQYARVTGHMSLHSKYQQNGFGFALSMFPDGRIRKNRIVGIYPSGEQQTYEVKTTTGKSVHCTINHRFPTPNGYKTLQELSVGDQVYCKGDYETDTTKYPFTDGNFQSNVPQPGEKGFQQIPDGASVVFHSERDRHVRNQDPCECCHTPYTETSRFELHHSDFDRTNNAPDNLKWLCASCHKKVHYKNGRRKIYEKGIPTYVDTIESITPLKVERTYDLEMDDPAHTFISENGLVVSNCSHSYCVALDSLYEAWLKSHHPLEFYEVALNIYEKKGNKDKMNALKEEAESYFMIHFAPIRYGQDNRGIKAVTGENIITNSIASIKGFSKSLGATLYTCSQQPHKSFMEILRWLDAHSVKRAKVEPLIKIDYFQQFGNNAELLRLVDIMDFFKNGTAKTIRKEKLNAQMETFVSAHGTDKGTKGAILKSYTITDMDGLLMDLEKYIMGLHIPELPFRTRAQNQKEVLGYVDLTTHLEADRRKIYILDVRPLKSKFTGKTWSYAANAKSIGSGKTSRIFIKPFLFEKAQFAEGDILYAHNLHEDEKGYWWLLRYDIVPA